MLKQTLVGLCFLGFLAACSEEEIATPPRVQQYAGPTSPSGGSGSWASESAPTMEGYWQVSKVTSLDESVELPVNEVMVSHFSKDKFESFSVGKPSSKGTYWVQGDEMIAIHNGQSPKPAKIISHVQEKVVLAIESENIKMTMRRIPKEEFDSKSLPN